MTTISGDCTMFVTNSTEAKFENGEGAVGEYVAFTENFTYNYNIAVKGYEDSYFMLTALVVRKSRRDDRETQPSSIGLVLLTEGVAQTFTIDQGSHQTMQFGVRLPLSFDFTLSVMDLEGSIWSEIVPMHRDQSTLGDPVILNSTTTNISSRYVLYTEDNEFIVRVHSVTEPATFTIVYHIPKS